MVTIHQTPPATIAPDHLYRLSDIQKRLAISEARIKRARKSGLVVHKFGKALFCLGRTFIEHVLEHGERC